MNIIIPMAGHSRRFAARGYSVPKPFIEIDGRPMIHWVCDMFSPKDRIVFVVQRAHAENPEFREVLRGACRQNEILSIEPHELGPVFSALAAESLCDAQEPVLISYCDFFQHWDYPRFLQQILGHDGGIAAFRGFHPASFGETYYAYLSVNEHQELVELREKQSFTPARHEEYASTGIYYFGSMSLYQRYAREVLGQGLAVGGEYYVSLLYNLMMRDGLHVRVTEVDRFICWGTPDDLEEYIFWSSYFRSC